MKKITAIIERGDDGGFSIYAEDIKGLVGTGMTEDEARLEIFREGNYYYTDVELDEAVPAGYSASAGFSYAAYSRYS